MNKAEFFNAKIDKVNEEVTITESGEEIKLDFESFKDLYRAMTPIYNELTKNKEQRG